MFHSTPFLVTASSFCFDENILNKGAAPAWDLPRRLKTFLFLVEVQCPLGSGEDSDPDRLIGALYRPCIDCKNGRTDWRFFTVGALVVFRTSPKIHSSVTYWAESTAFLHRFFRLFDNCGTKIFVTLNHFSIGFFHVWYTSITLVKAKVIPKLNYMPHPEYVWGTGGYHS
jgi:hypothetical protein